MSSLTVFVAPPELSVVRDALADWSAMSLVNRYVWIDSGASDAVRGVGAIVENGVISKFNLAQSASQLEVEQLRLIVLIPAWKDAQSVDKDFIDDIDARFRETFMPEQSLRVRLFAVRAEEGANWSNLAHNGWHNLIIAPENLRDTSSGISQIDITQNPRELTSIIAANAASVAGLWTQMESSPLDELSVPTDMQMRVVRSFMRNVSAENVCDSLRLELFDLRGGLPRPRDAERKYADYLDDPDYVIGQYVNNLYYNYPNLLELSPEYVPPYEGTVQVTGMGAIKQFFQYITGRISSAPADIMHGAKTRVSAYMASVVQEFVYGNDSKYEVIINNRNSAGQTAGMRDLQNALRDLTDGYSKFDEHNGQGAYKRPDFAVLWEGLAEGALTLADARTRPSNKEMRENRPDIPRGIVRDSEKIAPNQVFTVPDRLKNRVSVPNQIHPADVRSADLLNHELNGLVVQDRTVANEAIKAQSELSSWRQKAAGSYTVQTTNAIFGRMWQASENVRKWSEGLRQRQQSANAFNPDEDPLQTRIRKRSRFLKVWLPIIFVIGAVIFAGLAFVLPIFIGVICAWLASALLGAIIGIWRNWRDEFQLQNKIRDMDAEVQRMQENLKRSVIDYARMVDLYADSLQWCIVLGKIINEPFGRVAETGGNKVTGLVGLPESCRLGIADLQEQATREVANELREKLFAQGWLSNIWEEAFNSVPRLLDSAVYRLTEKYKADILNESSNKEASMLVAWASALHRNGLGDSEESPLWRVALAEIANNREMRLKILDKIVDAKDKSDIAEPLDKFMGQIEAEAKHGLIGQKLFTAEGSIQCAKSKERYNFDGETGLSQMRVSVEVTDAFAPGYLLGTGAVSVDVPQQSATPEFPSDPVAPNIGNF